VSAFIQQNEPILLGSLSYADFPFLNKEELYYCLVYGRSVLLWSETQKTCRLRRFDVAVDEPINKAARSGCNAYVTSILMELAELTGNKKRESLYKWALREHSGSDEVMDAYDRLHGGEGYC